MLRKLSTTKDDWTLTVLCVVLGVIAFASRLIGRRLRVYSAIATAAKHGQFADENGAKAGGRVAARPKLDFGV